MAQRGSLHQGPGGTFVSGFAFSWSELLVFQGQGARTRIRKESACVRSASTFRIGPLALRLVLMVSATHWSFGFGSRAYAKATQLWAYIAWPFLMPASSVISSWAL